MGACYSRSDERNVGAGTHRFRLSAVAEALFGDNYTHRCLFRQRNGLYGRRIHGAGVKLLFRTGRLDAVSDARLGTYWLLCGNARKMARKKQSASACLFGSDRRVLRGSLVLFRIWIWLSSAIVSSRRKWLVSLLH